MSAYSKLTITLTLLTVALSNAQTVIRQNLPTQTTTKTISDAFIKQSDASTFTKDKDKPDQRQNNLRDYKLSGPDVTGGGDSLVMSFQNAGANGCAYFKQAPAQYRYEVDAKKFCDAVENVRVISQEKTFLEDGTEVDATNKPAKAEIRLSQFRNFGKTELQILSLAIHEYVSIIGMNDKNYRITNKIMLKIPFDPNEDDNFKITPGTCRPINAIYDCTDNHGPLYMSIKTIANKYIFSHRWKNGNKWEDGEYNVLSSYPHIPDGVERRVGYDNSNRDTPWEQHLKAQCSAEGFLIDARNNDFGCEMNPDGSLKKCTEAGRSEEKFNFIFLPDSSQVVIRYKYKTTMNGGSKYETKEFCRRVPALPN